MLWSLPGGRELHIKETARTKLTEQHWNIYDADVDENSWRGSWVYEQGNFLWKLVKYSRFFKYLKFYLSLLANVEEGAKNRKRRKTRLTNSGNINDKVSLYFFVVRVSWTIVERNYRYSVKLKLKHELALRAVQQNLLGHNKKTWRMLMEMWKVPAISNYQAV